MKLVIATTNKDKVREYRALLSPLGYECVTSADVGVSGDIEETGDTFEENSRIKAQAVYALLGKSDYCVIADDSGLEVEFLDGRPGVYSARYGGAELDDVGRYELLLTELGNTPKELRKARYVCAIYFIRDEHTQFCVSGTFDGYIGFEPRGNGGFGYDPIFMLEDDTSVAELSDEAKNKISHRGKAAAELAERLRELR